MIMQEAFAPSVLLGEMIFHLRDQKGIAAEAVARLAGDGFYESVEILFVSDAAERRRIRELASAHRLSVILWNAPIMLAEGLSLATPDEVLRRRSVARMKEHLEMAAECGVSDFGVMAGPDPGPAQRAVAREQVYQSLCELAEAAKACAPLRIVLEPVDRIAWRKGFIGPADEAGALIKRLRERFPDVGICWDMSHTALNGEDLLESLNTTRDVIVRMHVANPIVDRNREDFGDHHIPFGPPGLFTIEDVAAVFRHARRLGILGAARPFVGAEIRSRPGDDPWHTESIQRTTLEKAWALASKEAN